jgi:two-component system cell cycle sensor histidine kinase/response regulator CckA
MSQGQRDEEGELRYRQLVELSPFGVAVHSDGNFRYVNPATVQLLGYSSASELVGRPVLDVMRPERRFDTFAPGTAAGAAEPATTREYRIVGRDGRSIHVEAAEVETTFEGRPATQIALHDITERREAEDALRASEARFRSLSVASPLGIFQSDDQGSITFANPQVLRIFSITEAEGLGQGWLMRVHPDDVPPVVAGWAAALREQRAYAHEYRLCMPDGAIRWVHCRAAPLHDAADVMIGNVGTIEDVTDRKALEEQLRHSQKMDAVGQLAGGVAHDFNNMLTVIRMNAELTLDELGADHPLHADVQEVVAAAGRAATLTRQLLAFSRRQMLQPQVLGLNSVIADLQKMLARLIGEDIEFSLDLAEDLAPVLADPGQLEQVLVNLAVNARDAMPHGGALAVATRNVTLSVPEAAGHAGAHPGVYVTVALRDTGAGISAAVQARMFEPFFTTKGPGSGTGLGLSTVYGIVTQSGGFVEVKSAPGQGAEFTVYLPAAEAAVQTMPRATVAALPPAGGSETILLVEDEDPVRAIAHRVLTRHGYTVIEARHGAQGLALLASRGDEIDAVLTDAVMPQMSGPELARTIKALRPELPVIMMSGYTDADVDRRGPFDAATSILPKPFTVESLLNALQTSLARSRARTRAADRP